MSIIALEPDRREWEAGLTCVPYWVYADPEVLSAEQARLFEGPV
jgi:hypothetical protein